MMYVKYYNVRIIILLIDFKSVYYIKAISNNYVRMYGKRRNQFKPGYNHENLGLSSDLEKR